MVAATKGQVPLFEVRILRYVREPFYEFHPRGRKTIRYERREEYEQVGEPKIVDIVELRKLEKEFQHDDRHVLESKRHFA